MPLVKLLRSKGGIVDYIDPVEVSPESYQPLLDNDNVRVLRMELKAGQSDKVHSHPDETVYFIQGGKVKIHLPNGDAVDAEIPDGHVMWNAAWTHRVENVGSTDVVAIIVEAQ